MVSPTPRPQVSLTKGAEPELQKHLAALTTFATDSHKSDTVESLHHRITAGHCVRQALIDNTEEHRTQDVFRLEDGFETVLAAIADLCEASEPIVSASDGEQLLLENLQTLFSILSSALHKHRGNHRFFKERVDGGGWERIRSSLLHLLTSTAASRQETFQKLTDRLFGYLLACSINDETVIPVYHRIRSSTEAQEKKLKANRGDDDPTSHNDDPSSSQDEHTSEPRAEALSLVVLRAAIEPLAAVHNPDSLVVLFQLWKSLHDGDIGRDSIGVRTSPGVLESIRFVGDLSTQNLAALHSSTLLNVVLAHLSSSSLQQLHVTELRGLALSLLHMGVSTLDNARILYSMATSSPLISDILLTALKVSRSPSYVHFDLSTHGFSSIELPGIGKSFPPTSPGAGYTLSLWLNIIKFDPNCHTTIFGAYESSQTCFVLVYLEIDSRNLILQTSVTSSRPSVRFKSTSFDEGRWYHVVIVHRRPRTTMSSRASLFIDGDFVEQVRSNYPLSPPAPNNNRGPTAENNRIQAFLGTPQDLAPRLGKGLMFSQWRLASAHLFGEALTDDLIAVHYQLGPRYYGNYQDCLGSFQTYKASAALNIRNEMLHPGKEERSDIVSAIRQKASALLPETYIILNISPSMVLDDDDQNNIDERQLLKGFGKEASKNLRNVTRGGRNAIAVNGAIPSINEALQYPSGFAVLTGNPTVVVPQALDDASWQIGGCAAVGLALIDAADTAETTLVSLKILFESVKDSWRNSEAMERENGFGVLATLLADKFESIKQKIFNQAAAGGLQEARQQFDSFGLEILTIILVFVGYQPERPRESIINNPLAYRILLVDVDMWRHAGLPVQRLFYRQFSVFGVDSKYHHFNAKRLSKMRT